MNFYKDIKLCRKGNRNIGMYRMLSCEAAKVLLFTHLYIGKNRKMIAQLFIEALELQYVHFFIRKNIIDPQNRGYAAESTAQAAALFNKCVLHLFADSMISIAVGHIIKIAGNDHRVWTFVNFRPYPVGLYLSF